jgi:hypothetical protein
MEHARERAAAPEGERDPTPTGPAAPVAANGRGAAWAAAARHVARHAGNRATQAMLQREQTSSDTPVATPPAESEYEFSDDPLAFEDWGSDSLRVKPGPVRATLIRPRPGQPDLNLPPNYDPAAGEWLENALKKDPLLKELPDWARTKAIDALKDADELAAEKIIGALPWDDKTKAAATAAIKSILQLAKGRKFKMPEAPPGTRAPDWQKMPDLPKAPGEKIFMLPPIRW